jgi:uracil permease
MTASTSKNVLGFLPDDKPPIGAMLSLGFQQVLTMFPATVLVAALTKFDVGVTLLAHRSQVKVLEDLSRERG